MSKEYAIELGEVLANLPFDKIREAIDILSTDERMHRGDIFVCGNGGSASTASHFVCDLVKFSYEDAQCLNDNTALLTAFGNDDGYENTFTHYFNIFSCGALIVISTSGNSANIIEAVKAAKSASRFTCIIALTGNNGGKLAGLADIEIRVPSNRIQIIEDAHLAICHMIAIGLGA